MKRFLLRLAPLTAVLLTGCALARIDFNHVLLRSDKILSLEQEREVLSRGRLDWTADGRVRVLYVQGTPYERGYQHGALLRREIQDNLGYMYAQAIRKFRSKEMFAEAYERLRPFIPAEYIEEMHGLAHGARIPLELVHHIHALPSLTEWGGKQRLKGILKQMLRGELGTSCSNFAALGSATVDQQIYTVRILDWGLHRISKLHEYPLLLVGRSETGHTYLNIGWMGFIGAVSGMNEQGITLGEMGYGDPPHETLRGKPMVFLLREVLSHTRNLAEVRQLLSNSAGTNSFAFLMSDGKTSQAEFYLKDAERFLAYPPGERLEDDETLFPSIADVSYGGHFQEKMYELLSAHRGSLEPELFKKLIIPEIAMKSNFQNVIYDPNNLRIWVSYAAGKGKRAAEQNYTFFDLRAALRNWEPAPAEGDPQ